MPANFPCVVDSKFCNAQSSRNKITIIQDTKEMSALVGLLFKTVDVLLIFCVSWIAELCNVGECGKRTRAHTKQFVEKCCAMSVETRQGG